MTRNQLLTALNKLCHEMEDYYDINCGGCCYIAAVIAENLESVNIPFALIHYGLHSCHYAIKVNDRYLNRSDCRKEEIVDFDEDITSEEIYNIYYDGDYNGEWNKMYNKRWNLIVSSRIKALFRKYANSRA